MRKYKYKANDLLWQAIITIKYNLDNNMYRRDVMLRNITAMQYDIIIIDTKN